VSARYVYVFTSSQAHGSYPCTLPTIQALLSDIHGLLSEKLFNLAPHLGVCDPTDMTVVEWLYEQTEKKVTYKSFCNALRMKKIIHQEGVHTILRSLLGTLECLVNPSLQA
jgi:hypothetical protein